MKSFSESLQFELHPFNSRVKIVEPGPIKTGFCDRSMESMQKAGETEAGPGKAAEVIFRAATDGSLRKLLPDRLFFGVVRGVVLR